MSPPIPTPPVTVPTVISAHDVEQAVIDALKVRLAYYMEQLGHPVPRSYGRAMDHDRFPEQQTPAIVVVSAGMEDKPLRLGDGTYIGYWRISIDVTVNAKDADAASKLSKEYIAVIRAILLQQPSMGGFARGLTWMDESYLELPPSSRRSMTISSISFIVEVANVVNARELPFMTDGPVPTPSGFQVEEPVTTVVNEEVIP